MTISQAYELATDGEFRLVAGFTSPPRAGVVTTLEAGGQVRVAMDDADGADVLAWPLNGFTYAVGDVVFVAFAADSPESGIVVGSKGSVPLLDGDALPGHVTVAGTPAAGRVASWADADTVQDAGFAASDAARLSGANTFTQEQSITESNAALYAGADASHNAFLSIDNPSETAGTSAGIALKVENASGALQRWFLGLVSTASGYARMVLKQRTGTSTYAERLAISEVGAVTLGLGKLGVGVDPTFGVHVSQKSGSGKGLLLAGKEQYQEANGVDSAGVILVAGVNRTGNRQLWVGNSDNLGSATEGFFRLFGSNGHARMGGVAGNGSSELPLVLNENKKPVGIGVEPQAALHVHNGTGGMMFATVDGINSTTALVILANGTGDVVRGLAGQIVVTDGSATAANTLTMLPGDTLDIAVGSLAVRLELLASGQLQVKRQSGTGSATVALLGVWL